MQREAVTKQLASPDLRNRCGGGTYLASTALRWRTLNLKCGSVPRVRPRPALRGRRVSAAASDVVEVVNPVPDPANRALQVPGTSMARCPSENECRGAEAVHERVT